jgi:hypothetical protein
VLKNRTVSHQMKNLPPNCPPCRMFRDVHWQEFCVQNIRMCPLTPLFAVSVLLADAKAGESALHSLLINQMVLWPCLSSRLRHDLVQENNKQVTRPQGHEMRRQGCHRQSSRCRKPTYRLACLTITVTFEMEMCRACDS